MTIENLFKKKLDIKELSGGIHPEFILASLNESRRPFERIELSDIPKIENELNLSQKYSQAKSVVPYKIENLFVNYGSASGYSMPFKKYLEMGKPETLEVHTKTTYVGISKNQESKRYHKMVKRRINEQRKNREEKQSGK